MIAIPTIEYGISDLTIYPYALYGLILCGGMGDIDSGYKFGQITLSLLDRFKTYWNSEGF